MIALIAKNDGFFTAQTGVQHSDFGHLGGRAFDGMNQFTIVIDANMGCHAKVPLIVGLGLGHLRITLFILVLGETWCSDQRDIDHHSVLHGQVLVGERPGRFGNDSGRKIVSFQQMLEAQDGAFIQHDIFEGVQHSKAAKQGDIVQSLFHDLIRVGDPFLHEVNAQSCVQRHWRTAIAALEVARLDQHLTAQPRHNRIHLRQEHGFPALLAGVRQRTRFDQGQLLHRLH